MMKFGVRVALGAATGLLLAVGLTWLLGAWWIGALAGGLLGPVVFLGTFFVWSADRLDEGYEQVLFDRPNTLISGVFLVAFAGLAFGTGAFLSPEVPHAELVDESAYAALAQEEARIVRIALAFEAARDAPAAEEDAGDLDALVAEATAARTDIAALEVPDALVPAQDALWEAASFLEAAAAYLPPCRDGDKTACLDARLSYADAQRALDAYAAVLV